MNLKQLFCKHIWKDVSEDFLNKGYSGLVIDRRIIKVYGRYENFAVHQECVKCGKKQITTREYLIEVQGNGIVR